ncbi:MAG: CHAD domain-containing protein [Lentisphaerota bacterium]
MKQRIRRGKKGKSAARTSEPGKTGAAGFARARVATQYRVMLDQEPGILLGQRIPLHDYRVALRRIRLLLRLFRPAFGVSWSRALARELDWLSNTLGSARDVDVWIHYLSETGSKKTDIRTTEFINRQMALKQHQHQRVIRLMAGAHYKKIKAAISRIVHGKYPGVTHPPPLQDLAARSIRKMMTRTADRYEKAHPLFKPTQAHALRIACRKARYACEFFGELLGKPVQKMGSRMKNIQSILGHIHDRDVWNQWLSGQRGTACQALRRRFARQREEDLKTFKKAWARWDQPQFHRKLNKRLSS